MLVKSIDMAPILLIMNVATIDNEFNRREKKKRFLVFLKPMCLKYSPLVLVVSY